MLMKTDQKTTLDNPTHSKTSQGATQQGQTVGITD